MLVVLLGLIRGLNVILYQRPNFRRRASHAVVGGKRSWRRRAASHMTRWRRWHAGRLSSVVRVSDTVRVVDSVLRRRLLVRGQLRWWATSLRWKIWRSLKDVWSHIV